MDLRTTSLSLSLAVLILLCTVHPAYTQAYHFSNGWRPGRKRSADTYINPTYSKRQTSASHSSQGCVIRPQVQQVLLELLQTELVRMVSECHMTRDRTDPSDSSSIRTQDLAAWIQSMRNQQDDDNMKNI